MNPSDVFAAFCSIPESKRKSALESAVREYALLLSEIYNDIYESCIKVFYSSYKPEKYKRHGDIVGFNLYSGFYSQVGDLRIEAMYVANEMLSYRGISREEVLNNVVNGQRGSKARDAKDGPWPRNWSTSYPNTYSKYSIWESSADTIETILDDFDNTAGEQTANIFWEILSKYI